MSKFTAIAGLVALSLTALTPVGHFYTMETISGVVITEKERVSTKDGSRFMIWTENETFENTDSWLALKFNSADIYGQITVGATCDLTVNWWRVPFMSWNRNILSATCS